MVSRHERGRSAGEELPLALVGCDFRTAPARIRELLLTSADERRELHESLCRIAPEAGLLTLETCNRVEWLVAGHPARWLGELLQAQMESRAPHGDGAAGEGITRLLTGQAAAAHLLRVSAGLESLACGEAEVAGQLQAALHRARQEGTSNRTLNGLGRIAAGIARNAVRLGVRSPHGRGIHLLAGRFLASRRQPGRGPVVVAGMGEIGRKTADYLERSADFQVVRVNRTARPTGHPPWLPLAELPALLPGAAALVVASGAGRPYLTPAELAPGGAELIVLDLGIPRQLTAAAIAELGERYFSVDELVLVAGPGIDESALAALEVELERQLARFGRYCLESEWVAVLRRAHERRRELVEQGLERFAEQRLGKLVEPGARAEVVAAMRELVGLFSTELFNAVHEELESLFEPGREEE